MSENQNAGGAQIGQTWGPFELTLDEETIKECMERLQWENDDLLVRGIVPPGLTISEHARMNFRENPSLKAGIWAKSEHEFIKPFKVGSTITITGKVVEKYQKRGRDYVVSEYRTVDENGELLMRSRETGVVVEMG